MSDPKKICEDCGNKMTLILTSFRCDWCDGLVADEWNDNSDTTDPGYGIVNFKYIGQTKDIYDDNGFVSGDLGIDFHNDPYNVDDD